MSVSRVWFLNLDSDVLKSLFTIAAATSSSTSTSFLRVRGGLDIGDNTSIAPFVHVWCGGRVIIGANCMIGSHVAITSLTHDYTQNVMHNNMIAKPVVIEDEVWIGTHAIILPGIRVGRGAVIGAGSVVTRDIPPHSVAYGVPATVRFMRNNLPTSEISPAGP